MSHILLVEDDAFQRARLHQLLGSEFEIVSADSAAAALRALAGRIFDAVILDLDLPGFDGREMYQAIAEINPRLAERVILFHAGSRDEALQAWAESFGDRMIRKEDVFGLLDRVRAVTSMEYRLSGA